MTDSQIIYFRIGLVFAFLGGALFTIIPRDHPLMMLVMVSPMIPFVMNGLFNQGPRSFELLLSRLFGSLKIFLCFAAGVMFAGIFIPRW